MTIVGVTVLTGREKSPGLTPGPALQGLFLHKKIRTLPGGTTGSVGSHLHLLPPLGRGRASPTPHSRTEVAPGRPRRPQSPAQPGPLAALLTHWPGRARSGVRGGSASPGARQPPAVQPPGEARAARPRQAAPARVPVGSARINHTGLSQAKLLPSASL